MAVYWIGYDLLNHATFGQYETLIHEIQRLGGKRILYSDWILRSKYNSETLRNHLMQFIHANDRILVAEISTTSWASLNLFFNINNI